MNIPNVKTENNCESCISSGFKVDAVWRIKSPFGVTKNVCSKCQREKYPKFPADRRRGKEIVVRAEPKHWVLFEKFGLREVLKRNIEEFRNVKNIHIEFQNALSFNCPHIIYDINLSKSQELDWWTDPQTCVVEIVDGKLKRAGKYESIHPPKFLSYESTQMNKIEKDGKKIVASSEEIYKYAFQELIQKKFDKIVSVALDEYIKDDGVKNDFILMIKNKKHEIIQSTLFRNENMIEKIRDYYENVKRQKLNVDCRKIKIGTKHPQVILELNAELYILRNSPVDLANIVLSVISEIEIEKMLQT